MKKYSLLFFFFIFSLFSKVNAQFSFDNIQFWVGDGSNIALLVIDFNDGNSPQSYAWGYRFNGTPNAEKMILDIDSADECLQINALGGFISEIFYNSHSAVGQYPYFWGTFSGNGLSWTANLGCSELLNDSIWFGLSYTDFDSITYDPLIQPEIPVAAHNANGLSSVDDLQVYIWPNPAADFVRVSNCVDCSSITIINSYGQIVDKIRYTEIINVSGLFNGVYFMVFNREFSNAISIPLIIQR